MARKPDEDLFRETTMSFGEHLEELRVVLFRALVGLMVCILLGLAMAKPVVKKIQGPLKDALEEYYLLKAKEDLAATYSGKVPLEMMNLVQKDGFIPESMEIETSGLIQNLKETYPDQFGHLQFARFAFSAVDLPLDKMAPFLDALVKQSDDMDLPGGALWNEFTDPERAELLQWQEDPNPSNHALLIGLLNNLARRTRLGNHAPFERLLEVDEPARMVAEDLDLEKPSDRQRLNRILLSLAFPEQIRSPRLGLVKVPVWKPIAIRVQTLNAYEAFMIWLKAAFISGLVMASPWVFYHIWSFVAAGLYKHEKKSVYVFLPFSLILFLAGASMAFFFVFEPVLNFLFSFNRAMEIDPDPRISEWLGFVMFLPIGFGIAFQLPLVMLFVNRLGVVSVQTYLEKWRIAILAIFVASMLLTPADPVSMLMMAVPLTVLYFLGVGLCQWLPRNRNPFPEAYEP